MWIFGSHLPGSIIPILNNKDLAGTQEMSPTDLHDKSHIRTQIQDGILATFFKIKITSELFLSDYYE